MNEYKSPPQFLWRNMPQKHVPACQTFEQFLDSAQRRHIFDGDFKITLQQVTEAKATFFDAWVWKGCRDSKRMAEFYERLELAVISHRNMWRELAEKIGKNRTKKKGNYLLVDKETLREFAEMNMREAEKEITQLRELSLSCCTSSTTIRAAGFNEGSSVNTKSISGETDDDAASLTSEPIHKRLNHSDK